MELSTEQNKTIKFANKNMTCRKCGYCDDASEFISDNQYNEYNEVNTMTFSCAKCGCTDLNVEFVIAKDGE